MVVGIITAVSMLLSELMAKIKKKKIQPTGQAQPGKVTISKILIPFTNLNIVFAFGIMIHIMIQVMLARFPTQLVFPKISVQITIMLLCLLLCNPAAKSHIKRRVLALRGIDLGLKNNKIQPLEIWTSEMPMKRMKKEDRVQEEAVQSSV